MCVASSSENPFCLSGLGFSHNNWISSRGAGHVGAFCTQHSHNPQWGALALDMLAAGRLPDEVLGHLLRDDPDRDKRQLAIIDMKGRAANRNPANADPSAAWWGALSGRFYACQGNTLVGREVILAMAAAYEQTEGGLADRQMAALVAGDEAGGDRRGRLAAGLRAAGPGIKGGLLELDIDESGDAVAELNRLYEGLRQELCELEAQRTAAADEE